MSIIHESGYIALTSYDETPVMVRVSKIVYMKPLESKRGNTGIVLDGEILIEVNEKINEVFEKIDAYIAPHLR